ncbi:MAG: hypothetical protein CMN21_24795 [Rubinisphaera sp.]|uniref:hypothetical protein n=1 Tax=Rubinisphaera sp. TaxID=2024857 RepID=UPI000C11CBEB|nr:hypothetical protein [Rubinisphaera sp.]MBV12423.1 hypothetical protein [Rubinisphaera sp.]
MSIPIPQQRPSPPNEQERRWLRRVRGTTLGTFADCANHLLFRQGLAIATSSFIFPFTRGFKASSGSGNLDYDADLLTTVGTSKTYYLDYFSNVAAEDVALVFTFVSNTSTGKITAKLREQSGTVDPSSGSGVAFTADQNNGTLPQASVVMIPGIRYEYEDGGVILTSEIAGFLTNLTALRIQRLIAYRQPTTGSQSPRRLSYGSSNTGSGKMYTVEAVASDGAAILEISAFEVPKLFV